MSKKIRKKKTPEIEYKNMTAFKAEEKRYKYYKNHDTDFSGVEDISKLEVIQRDNYSIYKLHWPEGVYLIKNFLSFSEQIAIAKNCLNTYIEEPYRTNLFIYAEDHDF